MYNVLMELKSGNMCEAYDIPERTSVIEKYIIPYLLGKEFVFDGRIVDKENIERIIVSESHENIECLVNRHRDNMRNSTILLPVTRRNTATDFKYVKIITDELIEEAQKSIGYESNLNNVQRPDLFKKTISSNKKIFVVYGHDEASKSNLLLFIRSVGLEPIVLDEQPNSGRTIIEKIDSNSDVGFAVVLYTPDDSVKNHYESYKQPRPNVFFEYGYFMGKLGRGRMALLKKETEEMKENSDIIGTGYIKIDDAGGWKMQLARELKVAGYEVDMNRLA